MSARGLCHDELMTRNPRSIARPARRLVVTGSADRAVDTIVAGFAAEKFRRVSSPGEHPVVLECGSRILPLLFASLWFVPGRIGENSRFGRVAISVGDPTEAGTVVTVALVDAVSGYTVVPLVLRSIDRAAATLRDAGVLADLGPVVSASSLPTVASGRAGT
jgi:hypothetical protein